MTRPTLDPYAWHVYACLRGNGRRTFGDELDFVFYVQRYTKAARGFTGEISLSPYATEAEAQGAADRANVRGPGFQYRGTYL
jgi:hypothetical protein